MQTIAFNPSRPLPPGCQAGRAFGAIVDIVRKKTGLDYTVVFNRVKKDNADLLAGSVDPTKHTGPLLRLLNRAEMQTGRPGVDCTEQCAGKITRLTNRFLPALSTVPTALQWSVLERAAAQLEKCGIPLRLFNRTSSADASKQDWKTANDRAGDALTFLEDREAKSDDIGASERFQNAHATQKWRTFKSQVDRLMADEGLTVAAAFARLKEAQPIFWTHALLNFEPKK